MDLQTRIEKLRSILESKKNKEDVSEADLAAVGLTAKSRIKDIEKEIKAIRTKVSSQIKHKVEEEVEAELRQEAEDANMTLDEYKEQLAAKAHEERKKELLKNAKVEGNDLVMAVAKERKKKNQARAGDFD